MVAVSDQKQPLQRRLREVINQVQTSAVMQKYRDNVRIWAVEKCRWDETRLLGRVWIERSTEAGYMKSCVTWKWKQYPNESMTPIIAYTSVHKKKRTALWQQTAFRFLECTPNRVTVFILYVNITASVQQLVHNNDVALPTGLYQRHISLVCIKNLRVIRLSRPSILFCYLWKQLVPTSIDVSTTVQKVP